jgi:hypothetical protein
MTPKLEVKAIKSYSFVTKRRGHLEKILGKRVSSNE